ncbi:hypothetical protein HanLR1_Chr16g0623771 [Helianthus annuus]|nr:hypothetical protein HanLR1_Chr16g0623771 [Helianthus annuus]
MAWRGSLSRTFISTTRPPSFRPTTTLPRHRLVVYRLFLLPDSTLAVSSTLGNFPTNLLRSVFNLSSMFCFICYRTLGELGCAQSLLPMFTGARLMSHIAVNMRPFCELVEW